MATRMATRVRCGARALCIQAHSPANAMLTNRDVDVMRCLGRYYLLDRRRLQALCFPGDTSGRITRRRLLALCRDRFIHRTRMEIVNPKDGMPAPAYFLAVRGREYLAE